MIKGALVTKEQSILFIYSCHVRGGKSYKIYPRQYLTFGTSFTPLPSKLNATVHC